MKLALSFLLLALGVNIIGAVVVDEPSATKSTAVDEGLNATKEGFEFFLEDPNKDEESIKKFESQVAKSVSSSSTFETDLQPQDIKLKKAAGDNGRLLAGSNNEDSFFGDVVARTEIQQLGNKMPASNGQDKSLRGHTSRQLETNVVCLDDGTVCGAEDYPGKGFHTFFLCDPSAANGHGCDRCYIFANSNGLASVDAYNDPMCTSCKVCSKSVSFDCDNIANGSCVKRTCSGTCTSDAGSKVFFEDPNKDEESIEKFESQVAKSVSSSSTFEADLRPQDIKLKKAAEGNGRLLTGNNHEDSFFGDVVARTEIQQLGNKMPAPKDQDKSLRGHTSRQLETNVVCLDDGTVCGAEDYPGKGFHTFFLCDPSAANGHGCDRCYIFANSNGLASVDAYNDPMCTSCKVCSKSVSFDCDNIASGSCVKRTCSGTCISGN